MHPVRVNTYNLMPGKEPRHLENGLEHGTLSYLEMDEERLAYALDFSFEEHPKLKALEAHVLPKFGIRVVRFEHRKALPPGGYDYYVDIVRVAERGEHWTVRDLYLDVLVFEGVRTEILDTDEYLEAIHEGHLNQTEAAFALSALHRLLNGLGECDYSMKVWLKREVGMELAF